MNCTVCLHGMHGLRLAFYSLFLVYISYFVVYVTCVSVVGVAGGVGGGVDSDVDIDVVVDAERGPRPPPTLNMWPATNIGDIHTVISPFGKWYNYYTRLMSGLYTAVIEWVILPNAASVTVIRQCAC